MKGLRQTICAAGETFFRWLGTVLGRGCDRIADWFAECGR